MTKLVIQHVENSNPTQFEVVRAKDNKRAVAAAVAGPVGFPVAGAPQSDLSRELRWYLEDFLDYPFPPKTQSAEAVKKSLREWGKQAFGALFNNLDAGGFLNEATAGGLDQLQLEIVGDDPAVLAWPWEALYHPRKQTLAHRCQIVRRLNSVDDPEPLRPELPRDHVSILLVTARPFEDDVKLRSVSRPLVELVRKENLPARITVLRPPTLEALGRHLEEHPGSYHIVHFDGHGSYAAAGGTGHTFSGSQGHLTFEDADGKPDRVPADKLSLLLAEHRIPAVVLNACQSGMVNMQAEDAFASVAASLLRAGVRSVVAMGYSLYVSAAQQFLPEFYRRLFKSGSFSEATRAGRQQLLRSQGRVSPRGRFDLDDWVVPVVYEQQPLDLAFTATAEVAETPQIPDDVSDAANPYGLIGRDGEILQLERAMHAAPAGMLVCGLGGVGKTTLAKAFARWLIETGGLESQHVFWFRFDESLRSAEYVINRLGEALFGGQFITAGLDQRIDALAQALRQHRLLIVWDNFEVVHGVEGTAFQATLPLAEQNLLKLLLERLRGRQTKVLITSRSEEDWLGPANRRQIVIRGLVGEERWEFCDAIIGDLAHKPNRDDPALADLMNLLDGHPLAMRVILTKLESFTPGQLREQLMQNISAFAGADASERHLFAALRFVEDGVPEELRELLIPLSLHERFVDADYLEMMAKAVNPKWSRSDVNRFVHSLCPAGLLRDIGESTYEMHPLLSRYLCQTRPMPSGDVWTRAFANTMAVVAATIVRKEFHEQRFTFLAHGANFHNARDAAQRLKSADSYLALTESLALYAYEARDFGVAKRLYQTLAEACERSGQEEPAATMYHQLGMVFQSEHQFDLAETWYLKSMRIKERLGDEVAAAKTYHQLGLLNQLQRRFESADEWYQKALRINERLGDERGAAITYHQLGRVAEERRLFDQAEARYKNALEIFERLENERGVSNACHQLGVLAQSRRQFDDAASWYKRSLEIEIRRQHDRGVAMSYHQLGRIAEDRGELDQAETWYHNSLEIKERTGDEAGAAKTYHQLGTVAVRKQRFAQAEAWYNKSLRVKERLGNEHGAALSVCQLGNLAAAMGEYDLAAKRMIAGAQKFINCDAPHELAQAMRLYLKFARLHLKTTDRATLMRAWLAAGLPDLPDEAFEMLESDDQQTNSPDASA